MEIVYRNCNLCEAHCGIVLQVDRADPTVLTIRGDREDPQSRGYICPKAFGLKGLQEDPDRIRRPLRRTNGDFEEIGWDEALDLVTGRLNEIRDAHGPNAIATYLGNPNAHDFGSILAGPIFQRSLGTRWRFSATSVDQLPKMVSSSLLFGKPAAFPIPDVDRTELLIVLGANPLVSNGSLLTAPDMRGRLKRLRERGGRLIVVDPRRSETAAVADRHLRIRPGTDAFLLLSMVQVLFEEDLVDCGHATDFVTGVEEMREVA
ncbi:MAG: molybdopterin-dependent oxidoreductase, partial [Myxococcota bacterium]